MNDAWSSLDVLAIARAGQRQKHTVCCLKGWWARQDSSLQP